MNQTVNIFNAIILYILLTQYLLMSFCVGWYIWLNATGSGVISNIYTLDVKYLSIFQR